MSGSFIMLKRNRKKRDVNVNVNSIVVRLGIQFTENLCCIYEQIPVHEQYVDLDLVLT